jgi:hypothetical protein
MLYKVCKIPLNPPFPKGELSLYPLFGPPQVEGARGDFIEK